MNAAIYVRLSNEDGIDGKSSSIENQILKLTEYVKDKNFKLIDTFIDDGYSGSDFNRPGFKSLIQSTQSNIVNTIIVKDLSRLGRNYIEVGKYVEEYFPANNIRFIAVDDNYDSIEPQDESITLRSFLNHLYLKECSKKIQQSVAHRAKTKNMSIDGCYGYKYDENKKIIIDEEVKQNVIDIFNLYANGLTMTQIGRKLSQNKVYSPGYYRYLRLGVTYSLGNNKQALTDPYKWGTNTLSKILNNQQYLGHAVNVKLSRANNRPKKKTPTILNNTHEPIISEELFNQVQDKLKQSKKFNISDEDNRLKNIVRCTCGHSMTYSSQYGGYDIPIYRCNTCNNTIKAKLLHSFLYQDCNYLISLTNEKVLKDIVKKVTIKDEDFNKLEQLQKDKQSLDQRFDLLFQDKIQKRTSEEQYKLKSRILKDEIELIEKELLKCSTIISKEKLFESNFKKFKQALIDIENTNDELLVIRTIVSKANVERIDKNKYSFNIEYRL